MSFIVERTARIQAPALYPGKAFNHGKLQIHDMGTPIGMLTLPTQLYSQALTDASLFAGWTAVCHSSG